METIRRLNQMNLHKQFGYEKLEDSSNEANNSSANIRIKLETSSSSISSSLSSTSISSTCSDLNSTFSTRENVENLTNKEEPNLQLKFDKSTQTIFDSYSSSELSSSDEKNSVEIESSGINSDFEYSEDESDRKNHFLNKLIKKKKLIKLKLRQDHQNQKKYLRYLNQILKKLNCLNVN